MDRMHFSSNALNGLTGWRPTPALPPLPAAARRPDPDAAARDQAIAEGMARIRDGLPPTMGRDTFFSVLTGITQDMKDVDGMAWQDAHDTFAAAIRRARVRLDALSQGGC